MPKQCPDCFSWWDDGANFCSIDGTKLPESTDPLAKLDYMTIRQVADCLKGIVERDYPDQAAIQVAIESLGKKIDVAIKDEKISAVGVIALGMLANVMERLNWRILNNNPTLPKLSTRIQ